MVATLRRMTTDRLQSNTAATAPSPRWWQMPRIQWNPVTLKRLRRFRRLKRAWWSLWLLVALYGVSLGAELICNNTPLYVRFRGRSYFPLLRYYPEDVFTGSGRNTRPDYKQLRVSPEFAPGTGNFMVFPIVPHGPYESIDPATIEVPDVVRLRFAPAPRLATINVLPDLTIQRAAHAGFFFDRDDTDVAGLRFTDHWPLLPKLRDAINLRFRNQSAPACTVVLEQEQPPHRHVEVALAEFVPRTSPPATVRLTLRELLTESPRPTTLTFDRQLRLSRGNAAFWQQLETGLRAELMAAARLRFEQPVESRAIQAGAACYTVSFERQDVRWPYPPCRGHWLGIDNAGRDVLARILYGLRTSLTFGLLLVLLAMAVGVTVGACQGYFGGALDISFQRFTEIWSAMPFLYVMILLGSIYGRSFLLLLFCYALFNWIGMSYYMRAEFLRLRHLPFVEAAQSLGLPHRKVIFRHILPNALVPLITLFPFSLVGAIGSLAALDFIGFGLPPPTPSWGELLQQAQQFRWAWWLILYPSLALFTVILLGVLIGEGIRNAYDPHPVTRLT